MSINYKETNVIGTKWTRACDVIINNPYNSTPVITFYEEEIINIDNTTPVINKKSQLSSKFDSTNTLHTQIYDKLNELYTLLREERDARLA